MLNIIVDEEHERRENDETRIDLYHQILRDCNLTGPDLELKVPDAGYASLYHYNKLSTEDLKWNLIHPRNKVCQAILATFRSIRDGYPARNTAGYNKKQNVKLQEHIDIALANSGILISEEIVTTEYPLRIVPLYLFEWLVDWA